MDDSLFKVLLAILAGLSTIFAAGVPKKIASRWDRRKVEVETASLARGSFIDDASDVVALYREALGDLRAQLETLGGQIRKLEDETVELRGEVTRLTVDLREARAEAEAAHVEADTLRDEVVRLQAGRAEG